MTDLRKLFKLDEIEAEHARRQEGKATYTLDNYHTMVPMMLRQIVDAGAKEIMMCLRPEVAMILAQDIEIAAQLRKMAEPETRIRKSPPDPEPPTLEDG